MKHVILSILVLALCPSLAAAEVIKIHNGPGSDTVTYDTQTGVYWAPLETVTSPMTYSETLAYIRSEYNVPGYGGLNNWRISYDEEVYAFRSHLLDDRGHEFDNFDPVQTSHYSNGNYSHYMDAKALHLRSDPDAEYVYFADIWLGVEYYTGGCFRDYGTGSLSEIEYWINNPMTGRYWISAVPEPSTLSLLPLSICALFYVRQRRNASRTA